MVACPQLAIHLAHNCTVTEHRHKLVIAGHHRTLVVVEHHTLVVVHHSSVAEEHRNSAVNNCSFVAAEAYCSSTAAVVVERCNLVAGSSDCSLLGACLGSPIVADSSAISNFEEACPGWLVLASLAHTYHPRCQSQ